MKTMTGTWRSIGIIHTPHKSAEGTPIQPLKAKGCRGTVEIDPELTPALQDLSGFERIWLICWFHRSNKPKLIVKPYMQDHLRGLFATRAPSRINPIGLSSVRLLKVEGNILEVEDVDMLDGTPILDIKPYVPRFDVYECTRYGWLEDVKMDKAEGKADGRFQKKGS